MKSSTPAAGRWTAWRAATLASGLAVLLALFVGFTGCAGRAVPSKPTGLEDLQITSVDPKVWIPGTRVVIRGNSFVDRSLGEPQLHVRGSVGGEPIDVLLQGEVTYVSPSELHFVVPMTMLGAEGRFEGEAELSYYSLVDNLLYTAEPWTFGVDMKQELVPSITTMAMPSYVNDLVYVQGKDFLLSLPEGMEEGNTQAAVVGCFQKEGTTACNPVGPITVPAKTMNPFERTVIAFPYVTAISGIGPGVFKGKVQIQNSHKGTKKVTKSAVLDVNWNIGLPRLVGAETRAPQEEGMPTGPRPNRVSQGQYLFFRGAGFIGRRDEDPSTRNEVTFLRILQGSFTPSADAPQMAPGPAPMMSPSTTTPETPQTSSQAGTLRDVSGVDLLPSFRDGRTLAYTLSSVDAIGNSPGVFTGTVAVVVRKGPEELRGTSSTITFEIVPPKQVVWVRFQDSYQYSLLYYGMHRMDAEIRKRALGVVRSAYVGVNIEFRETQPTDFELYSTVDISGPDPTGRSFGFDNSPGKDVGNLRLFDQVGGYYAREQGDTRKGYGGIFVEEMLSFSRHPPASIPTAEVASNAFDLVFDPFRVDMDGIPVSSHELEGLPIIQNGDECPDYSERPKQIACGVYVLGNIVGDTAAHEVGHSLGLAYPEVKSDACVHTAGNEPNRLMEAGGNRPFEERAQLDGQGPGVFCDKEYEYLRKILPSTEAATRFKRPGCGSCSQ